MSSDDGNCLEQFSSESINSTSPINKRKRKAREKYNIDFNQMLKRRNMSTPNRRRSDEHHPNSSNANNSSNSISIDYANTIILLLESLKHTQDQNTIKINNIDKLMNANNSTNLVAPNPLPPMPLKDAEDFLNMESYLENSDNYSYFINRLSVVGGTDVRNSTMNILKFILSDNLASRYNWAGRKSTTADPKLSFKTTLVMKAIYDSIKIAYSKLLPPDLNDINIEKAVKDWLKLAPQRFWNKSNK